MVPVACMLVRDDGSRSTSDLQQQLRCFSIATTTDQQHQPPQSSRSSQDPLMDRPSPAIDTTNELPGDRSTNDDTGTDHVGLYRLLNEQERALLQEQRALTEQARQLVQRVYSIMNTSSRAAETSSSLFHEDWLAVTDPSPMISSAFTVVVAGEYNAGKSTLINALLGQALLEAGASPTTDGITVLSHPDNQHTHVTIPRSNSTTTLHNNSRTGASQNMQDPQLQVAPSSPIQFFTLDNTLLQDLTLMDTPGTNAVWQHHTTQTLRVLPAADLILFVTSPDRPFGDSERVLLTDLLQSTAFGKSVIMVINKMDILNQTGGVQGAAEKQRVIDFVTHHATACLWPQQVEVGDRVNTTLSTTTTSTLPPAPLTVIAVSARDALAAKLSLQSKNLSNATSSNSNVITSSAAWRRSNFAALEQYLQYALTTETKIKSKLATPVTQVQAKMHTCLQHLQGEQVMLQQDLATLQLLEQQREAWRIEWQLSF